MKGESADLVRLAARLARILGVEDCVVIGGIAVAGHGYVRGTDDIDLIVRVPLAVARERLESHGLAVTHTRGGVLEGDFPCLKGTLEGVRFDVMPRLVPLEWERALEVTTEEGERFRLVDLEGLLRLKLKAQGPQDVLDVAVLVLRHPEFRERAREIAAAHRILERLDSFLANPRTRAAAEEQKAMEEKTGRTAKGPSKSRRRPRQR